ncbi:hypothetical protein [Marinoscillum sp.]|uniref:hypothetical protein n=1 Tax=Marinoscillum sp. TaxID=2024838 RepID=UPI003BA9A63F
MYFRNKKLEITDDYYETFDSSQLTYNGDIINKTNKYGFQEGLWISFFPDSTISTLEKYPDKVLYFEAEADWAKRFYSNGKLRSYHRKDTSQSWLESGELAYETIKYQINDTVFHRTFTLYENSQLKEKSLTKIYRVLYDTCDRLKEYRNETIYKESYYQNGQPKYLYSQDTSYQWYENGITKELTIGKERIIRFDSNRNLTSRVFRWKKPGRTCGYALSNSLYVMYANRNEIQEVRLIRDELTDDGTALGVSYTWRWDEENNLIESPRNWSEEMPWERFSSLLEEFHQKQQINK